MKFSTLATTPLKSSPAHMFLHPRVQASQTLLSRSHSRRKASKQNVYVRKHIYNPSQPVLM
jgi:hypothetical protein